MGTGCICVTCGAGAYHDGGAEGGKVGGCSDGVKEGGGAGHVHVHVHIAVGTSLAAVHAITHAGGVCRALTALTALAADAGTVGWALATRAAHAGPLSGGWGDDGHGGDGQEHHRADGANHLERRRVVD